MILSSTAPGQDDGEDGDGPCCCNTNGDTGYLWWAKVSRVIIILGTVVVGRVIIVLVVISRLGLSRR